MDQKKTRFLSYICPKCRQSVIVERDVFGLAASPTHIQCPCGKSELAIEFLPQRVRLQVPCVYCGREHEVTCPPQAFLREKALAFSCSISGLDCCYIGEKGPVYTATARLEQAIDQVEVEQEGEERTFLNEVVMEEVLSELKDIAARGGISCACGSKAWDFQVQYSAVELMCRECGAQMRIPAATADDIDDLCCKTRIVIRGRKKE